MGEITIFKVDPTGITQRSHLLLAPDNSCSRSCRNDWFQPLHKTGCFVHKNHSTWTVIRKNNFLYCPKRLFYTKFLRDNFPSRWNFKSAFLYLLKTFQVFFSQSNMWIINTPFGAIQFVVSFTLTLWPVSALDPRGSLPRLSRHQQRRSWCAGNHRRRQKSCRSPDGCLTWENNPRDCMLIVIERNNIVRTIAIVLSAYTKGIIISVFLWQFSACPLGFPSWVVEIITFPYTKHSFVSCWNDQIIEWTLASINAAVAVWTHAVRLEFVEVYHANELCFTETTWNRFGACAAVRVPVICPRTFYTRL